MSKTLPTGRCNFVNLNVKTTEYNTKCQCQSFWQFTPTEVFYTASTGNLDDSNTTQSAQRTSSNNSSEGESKQLFCVCEHHACFHDKNERLSHEEVKQDDTKEKERGTNSFKTAPLPPTQLQDFSRTLHAGSTTTIADHALAQSRVVSPGPSEASTSRDWVRNSVVQEGLGLSIVTTRDDAFIGRSPSANLRPASVTSSQTTDVTPPHLPLRARSENCLEKQYRASPRLPHNDSLHFATPRPLQHPQIQHLTPRLRQDTLDHSPSTVVDSPLYYTYPDIHNIYREIGKFNHVMHNVSMSFLPSSLQSRHIHPEMMSVSTTVDQHKRMIALGDIPYFKEEVQRKALAAENAVQELLKCLEQAVPYIPQIVVSDQRPLDSGRPVEDVTSQPSIIPPLEPSSSPPPASIHELPEATNPISDTPEVPLTADCQFKAHLQDLAEKLEGLEDVLEDTVNRAETAEDRVIYMESRMINVEDKIEGVAESFQKHKDDFSFRKRALDDQEPEYESHDEIDPDYKASSKRRRKRRKRHHENEKVLINKTELANSSVPTTTKSKSSFEKSTTSITSASFTSTSSYASSASHPRRTVLSKILLQLESFATRLAEIEEITAPTASRPWIVEIIVLPQCIWPMWKKKDGDICLSHTTPRAPVIGGKAWKRLHSRGLIRTVNVVGGEARDFERVVRKSFGRHLRMLRRESTLHHSDDLWEWSPLRKVSKQSSLRFLGDSEMEKGFWNAGFLKSTCAGPTTPSLDTSGHQGGLTKPHKTNMTEAKHRLYITDCWTGGMITDAVADTRDSTQMSSLGQPSSNERLRGTSVTSTPKSSSGTVKQKRRLKDTTNITNVSATFSQQPISLNSFSEINFVNGWTFVRRLPEYKAGQSSQNSVPDKGNDKDIWAHDDILDGPLVETPRASQAPDPPVSMFKASDIEKSPSTYRTAPLNESRSTNINEEDMTENNSRSDDIARSLSIDESIEELGRSFASQASFYGFDESVVKNNLGDIENQQDSPPAPNSALSHSSMPTPGPLISSTNVSMLNHSLDLHDRLETLQARQSINSDFTIPKKKCSMSLLDLDEERDLRARETRSPTVEDDPASFYRSNEMLTALYNDDATVQLESPPKTAPLEQNSPVMEDPGFRVGDVPSDTCGDAKRGNAKESQPLLTPKPTQTNPELVVNHRVTRSSNRKTSRPIRYTS